MTQSPHEEVDPLTAPVGTRFVIKQHHATALHHDVRLEMNNGDTSVLVSWAVPKGLPRRRGLRHLAIRTADHSMEEMTFSGTVLDDEFGPARIFDRGTYELVNRSEDRITFRLDGERLAGIWHLVHTGPEGGRDRWLAMMSEDLRRPGEEPPPALPMQATVATEPFDDPAWVFEPKWAGSRVIVICGEETRVVSPGRDEVTPAYPELDRLHNHVVALDCMLDGVIVALEDAPTLVVFDLLFLDGSSLVGRPLRERRLLLEELVVASDRIQVSPVTTGDGVALFEAVSSQGFSGIVAKRQSSLYTPGGQSPDWLVIDEGR
jgi:bifunctional non-homologous end joining protein LigD